MKYITMKRPVFLLFLAMLAFPCLQAQETIPLAKNHSKFLGNIIPHYVPAKFDTYWNQLTPENAGKWDAIEPTRGKMSWGNLDRAYKHARDNAYPFKLHTLVWGSQEPSWISSLSAQEQKEEIEELMKLIATRYKNIAYIDVVNEPLHAPSSIRDALGGAGKTGWDWVIWSFEKARQYFPNAKLHINDYGIISNPSEATRYREIIRLLVDRGLIDGVGLQCHHFNVNLTSVETIKSVLNSFARLGLPLYVSELDITGKPDWRSDDEYRTYISANPEEDEETQYKRYKEKFPVFWENSNVAGITLWGYIEGSTWAPGSGLLNANGTERKAMTWLKEYMASDASKVTNKFEPTGIGTLTGDAEIAIYPNPAVDNVTVEGVDIRRIDIYDLSGSLLLTEVDTKTLRVGHLAKGMYLLKIDAGGKTLAKKLWKK